MSLFRTNDATYRRTPYQSESHLEECILRVKEQLFGPGRVYLPVKRKIGRKGRQQNVPDGYLIDLCGKSPRLYVVENEVRDHDPLRHVAVQILQFSLSFEDERHLVKTILVEALHTEPDARRLCEQYAGKNGFRNLDHLLESLVFDGDFAALVIIDELAEELSRVLSQKFQFGVEVLELARFVDAKGNEAFGFLPFLEDLETDLETSDTSDLDTIVVPAQVDGYDEVFLKENRWYAIRIHGTMRPQIKYIAGYQTSPVSAITHLAPVKSIEPWKDTGKFVVNFSEPARTIGPIPLVKKGRVKAPQNIRYTTRGKLDRAETLDDVW